MIILGFDGQLDDLLPYASAWNQTLLLLQVLDESSDFVFTSIKQLVRDRLNGEIQTFVVNQLGHFSLENVDSLEKKRRTKISYSLNSIQN